jgi:hypothetical protein
LYTSFIDPDSGVLHWNIVFYAAGHQTGPAVINPDSGVLHWNIVFYAAGHQTGPAVYTTGSINQEAKFRFFHHRSPAWSGF